MLHPLCWGCRYFRNSRYHNQKVCATLCNKGWSDGWQNCSSFLPHEVSRVCVCSLFAIVRAVQESKAEIIATTVNSVNFCRWGCIGTSLAFTDKMIEQMVSTGWYFCRRNGRVMKCRNKLISVALYYVVFCPPFLLHVFALESWQSAVRHRDVRQCKLEITTSQGLQGVFWDFWRAKLHAVKVTADLPRTKIPGVSVFIAGSEWQDMSVRHLRTECRHHFTILC